ncbi:MAG: hypothetical protein OXF32_01920 [Anaerolineaceae bacterium]|nr:hypothetical protein [Anaerolineaceae bacterium]
MAALSLEQRVEKLESQTTLLREEILVSRRHTTIGFALILLVILVFGLNFADSLMTLKLSLDQVKGQLQEMQN